MKLEKVINYEFNKSKIENSIQEFDNKRYKIDYDYKTLRNLKSELEEIHILKYLNDNEKIISIEYMRDATSERCKRKLEREEYKQNKFNQVGIDLLIETETDWVEVDMKVLNYIPMSKGKPYNKSRDKELGVSNLVFQVDGKQDKGWANDRYKQTKVLIIYIPQVKTIYKFNYRNLTTWLNDKINNKEVTEDDYIVYNKGYGATSYKEKLISIPTKDIPKNVLVDIHKID